MIRFKDIYQLRETLLEGSLDKYALVSLTDREIHLDPGCEMRMRQAADDLDACMTFSGYRLEKPDGSLTVYPGIEYQPGSLRDDFDFGGVVLLNIADVISVVNEFEYSKESLDEYIALPDGGWYALRLALGTQRMIAWIPEILYTMPQTDMRLSGEKQHDYVDRRNREYQQAMEKTFIEHLEACNALTGPKQRVDTTKGHFPVTASIIIPVRNRCKTIADAVRSALSQELNLNEEFNVIVVDNGSTDGTSEILDQLATEDERLIVLRPGKELNLGIGGCWNLAVMDSRCGRYAVQLDSDDLYMGTYVLHHIVQSFRRESCAAVVGSYSMVDFDLNPIPPGNILHEEWTDEYGADNALRINGFGAPRAYYTGLLRKILFPNVSYGEDYAVMLRLSRDYYIGRIYMPIYYCRRWNGNSDANLSVEKTNEYNFYKDFLRSAEFLARIEANRMRQ